MTTLALINNQTMICENVSLDDRPASEIQIDGFLVLDLNEIECYAWEMTEDGVTYELVYRGKGCGGVGDVYENNTLVKPKPDAPVQPVSEGTQTL